MTDVLQALAGLDLRVVAAAGAVELVALACLTQVYRASHRLLGGRVGYRDALTICLGSVTLAELLPGGGAVGGVFAARRLTRHGSDPATATATVVVFGLVTIGTLGLLVGGGAAMLALGSPSQLPLAALGLGVVTAVVAVLAAAAAAARSARVRARLVDLLVRVARRGRSAAETGVAALERHGELLRRPGRLAPSAAWSAVNWTLDVTVLALLVHAAGGDAPLLGVLMAFGVANLLNGLPLTPGGLGVVEVGITGTLATFGIDPASAAVAAVAYRLVGHWLPVALASPLLARGLLRGRLAQATA